MPEYVYALHDFTPENDDEIPFKAGERIEVLEKDDQYGDGWWQGLNLAGKAGLFPKAYTAPAGPATMNGIPTAGTPLQPLSEEPDGAVMAATLTDVQEAIEQLGSGRRTDTDRLSRLSYSFRDDVSEEGDLDDGEEYHRRARDALLERLGPMSPPPSNGAANGRDDRSSRRSFSPPIDAEMSDESEDDEDLVGHLNDMTSPVLVSVKEEPEEQPSALDIGPPTATGAQFPLSDTAVPPPPATMAATTTITSPSVPQFATTTTARGESPAPPKTPTVVMSPATPPEQPTPSKEWASMAIPPTTTPSTPPQPPQPPAPQPTPPAALPPADIPAPLQSPIQFQPTPSSEPKSPTVVAPPVAPIPMAGLMSPTIVIPPVTQVNLPAPASPTTASLSPSVSSALSPNLTSLQAGERPKNPSDWTVDHVIEWAKSKGFDDSVCSKFREHDVTGDVLLELNDVNTLKEIEIPAFGKRMKLANAINELRRPASVVSSQGSGGAVPSMNNGQVSASGPGGYPYNYSNQLHSPNQFSTHSGGGDGSPGPHQQRYSGGEIMGGPPFPHFTPQQPFPHSQSAFATPMGYQPMNGFPGRGDLPRHDSDPGRRADGGGVNGANGANVNAPGVFGLGEEERERLLVGLGIVPPRNKNRPSSLVLDDEDESNAAKHTSLVNSLAPSTGSGAGTRGVDDRMVLSEGEGPAGVTAKRSKRRAGRSIESASSQPTSDFPPSSSTAPSSIPPSPGAAGGPGGVNKSSFESSPTTSASPLARPHKKSIEGSSPATTTHKDRLSFFGGTIGKSRKPPPSSSDHPVDEKSRHSRFSALVHTQSKKRPSTATTPSSSSTATTVTPTVAQERVASLAKDRAAYASAKESGLLRKRGSDPPARTSEITGPMSVAVPAGGASNKGGDGNASNTGLKAGQNVLQQIGEGDHAGWMRKKGERYNTWKLRYFVLKGPHLYYLRSKEETKLKGYINITGYKVVADETTNPGKYGFRIVHDTEKPHFFSSDEQLIVREWMKALMKATIDRDYSKPVVSSCNIPTIPLTVAQAMNPAPRPPSPTQRDATQRALRRENPNQLSSRDARILMGLPGNSAGPATRGSSTDDAVSNSDDKKRLDSFFNMDGAGTVRKNSVSDKTPVRPSREMRRPSNTSKGGEHHRGTSSVDANLLSWLNSNLPDTSQQATDLSTSLSSGLILFRLAESIKWGKNNPPPVTVPDSAFPQSPLDEKLEGYIKLFDFLVEHDIKVGCSINDLRTGKQDKIVQLVKALKVWDEKRKALARAVGAQAMSSGTFMTM